MHKFLTPLILAASLSIATGPFVYASSPAQEKAEGNFRKAISALGPSGWAKCVAADSTILALIARGDRIPRDALVLHDALKPFLAGMRARMIAARYSSGTLDDLVRSHGATIMSSPDPILLSFQIADQCVGTIGKAIR